VFGISVPGHRKRNAHSDGSPVMMQWPNTRLTHFFSYKLGIRQALQETRRSGSLIANSKSDLSPTCLLEGVSRRLSDKDPRMAFRDLGGFMASKSRILLGLAFVGLVCISFPSGRWPTAAPARRRAISLRIAASRRVISLVGR
jgi:hypothetical protein